MKYYFKVGRMKPIKLSGNDSFEALGSAILDAYHIEQDHLFMFRFSNGDETNSASPFGPMDDYREVSIEAKIKNRNLQVGEDLIFEYDYSSDWKRKVKLVKIE